MFFWLLVIVSLLLFVKDKLREDFWKFYNDGSDYYKENERVINNDEYR